MGQYELYISCIFVRLELRSLAALVSAAAVCSTGRSEELLPYVNLAAAEEVHLRPRHGGVGCAVSLVHSFLAASMYLVHAAPICRVAC